MIRRVVKVGAFVGVAGVTYATLKQNQWDASSIGIMRFGRAAVTVAKIACDYKFSVLGVEEGTEEYVKLKSRIHLRSANRLLNLCCTNGGVFIKVGQHVAALDYLLPEEYVTTLKILHSKAPRSSLEDVFQVVREDFGKEPSEIFSSFEDEPLGAASLAQVHKATLVTGDVVAVKVQHPKVLSNSMVDMATMEFLVHVVAKLFPEFSFMWLADETKRNLPLELNFVHEAHNTERVQKMFSHFSWLKVPKINWELSTTRVLTMEFCEGGQVNDKAYYDANGILPSEVSDMLGQLYSEMIFVQGYVHCDPHPGNILVKKTQQGTQLVLLDHGLYTNLTDRFRYQYTNLWLALLDADVKGIEHWGREMGLSDELYKLLACVISGRSWRSVSTGIRKKRVTHEESKLIKEFVAAHFSLVTKLLNMVPREMLLIFKTNDLIRGIESSLGTRGAARSFITMTKCCVKSLYKEKMRFCTGWMCRMKLYLTERILLSKLSFYQCYLTFRQTSFGSWLHGLLGVSIAS